LGRCRTFPTTLTAAIYQVDELTAPPFTCCWGRFKLSCRAEQSGCAPLSPPIMSLPAPRLGSKPLVLIILRRIVVPQCLVPCRAIRRLGRCLYYGWIVHPQRHPGKLHRCMEFLQSVNGCNDRTMTDHNSVRMRSLLCDTDARIGREEMEI
jgi:hypothetical protein